MQIKPMSRLPDKLIEEISVCAAELKCSLEIAQYILLLELRLNSTEKQLDKLWDDYRQRPSFL